MVCDNFWNSASLRDDLLLAEYDDELILNELNNNHELQCKYAYKCQLNYALNTCETIFVAIDKVQSNH